MMDVVQNIKGLTADSRAVQNGCLFAALPGVRFDGCEFIDQAVMNGATHVLAPTGTKVLSDVVVIESDDIRRDFALMAAAFYGAQPDNIIAITGTNGKTSTAEFCRQIFEYAGLKSASLGTLGLVSKHVSGENVMTTPDPVKLHALLADLKAAGVNHLAMEASSHGLDQARLDGVTPKVAAFTNLSQDHLDYHKTMDAYFDAKARLFSDILGDGGVSVINIDDEYGRKIKRADVTYGIDRGADFCLLQQTPTVAGQDMQIQYNDEIYNIHLPLMGMFQAYNAMCAAACCVAAGVDKKVVFDSLAHLKGVRGRMELAAKANGATAYIDYAHTPDALEKALTALRPHVAGRLIVVFGAGGDRDKAKRPLMGAIVSQYADVGIITDDNPRSEDPTTIRKQIFSACSMAENIGGRADAIAHAVSILNAGDVLLVAGKGHEQGQTIGDITHPFDDLTATRESMEALKK
ncbi:MAG: UDP-N-acetylmuramoyl-L-alanyl-D-glutamate--2,6-diaminopimelate ligase [Alphaproteobacteria bacterium]|nr:MAG: UDP-N-acetylmuramoyl-L-alanyl-D-glutamate--2,6-diaminopimelate ligase [Alphaproteobacteria bacterium]